MLDANRQEGHQGGSHAAQRTDSQPQALRRELWIDLEDTVITPVVNGWFNTQIINSQKIKDVLTGFAPHVVNIFSFAIWNQFERNGFNLGTREMLERHFNIKFNLVLTVDDDIIPVCCKQMGNLSPERVDFSEASAFWSKQGAFRLCMRNHATNLRRHHPNQQLHFLLLDDMVYNERTVWPDLQTIVEQRNIDQL